MKALKPYAIGLMSGTSLDGIDAALCAIEQDKVRPIAFRTYPYEETYKARLARALAKETATLDEISELNFSLGKRFGEASLAIIAEAGVKKEDVAFIASHGQTIWHEPHPSIGKVANTLQIGSPAVIATITGCQVISDFRSADVALGGEGAPLVPMTELVLYGKKGYAQAFLNIGGIANVTYLPPDLSADGVRAFDTGPGNVMIDCFTRRYFSRSFDDGGALGARGSVIKEMLSEVLALPAITSAPPKSTGRELFSEAYMTSLEKRYSLVTRPLDAIATVTMATALSIAYAIKTWLPPIERLVVSGGGCHNSALMALLKKNVPAEVITGQSIGIDPDSKEAVAFAELGLLTLRGRSGNVPRVTGASRSTVLGSITPGKEDE